MSQFRSSPARVVLPLLLIVLLTFTGCSLLPNMPGPAETVVATDPEALLTNTTPGTPPGEIIATETAAPAPTLKADLVILLALPDSDANLALRLQETLGELATADQLRFETRTDLAAIDLGPTARLVVILPPDPGVMNLAGANPQTQFLAVGIPAIQAADNVSVIGGGGALPDQRAFTAGYLAALISPDWRAGVIYPAGMVEGLAARNGFLNGLVFYCGLCRPAYPPFVQYPIYAELPVGASPAEIQAAVDTMTSNAVQSVYVAPGIESQGLFESLAAANLGIIAGSPPPAALASNWVASLRADESQALRQAWARLMAGESGIAVEVPLAVTDRNPDRLSVGRQRLVDNLLADLLAGFIDTGVNPETGELK